MQSTYSLKKRLIIYVSIFSVILGALLILFAYRIALEETNEILNAQMQNLAERVAVHDPQPSKSNIDLHRHYHEEDLFVDVWSYAEQHRPSAVSDLGLLVPAVPKAGFYMHETPYGIWHTYVLPVADYQIQVSQQASVRQRLAFELAANMFIPYILVLPFALLALSWIIRRNLRPLQDFRDELAQRKANALTSIRPDHYPEEIIPTIEEMNHLFERISLAQNEQKQFVADAAHELRTPLTALNLQIQVLMQSYPDDPAIANLSKGLERIRHLVSQLLSLAQQDASLNEVANFTWLDINDIAVNCVEQLIQFALQKEIDLGMEQHSVQVYSVESTLHSILYNLIDNAIKYTPRQGIINVTIQQQQHHVSIVVEDSGAGIDPHLYQTITQRFYRTQNHSEVGSGLGLSIVSKAVQQLHGELIFSQSEQLGGLKVQVKFLLHDADLVPSNAINADLI
ncbi:MULTISPECIES: ATP-binding protein [unclassified Acinetobacter]|uniref:ATP-binding protein n=1 Tax=unclassified Acinetobacter TaxID=196816 RepID=UPI0029351947|nr:MULTISPECIES: ATP-binding protein [unclassified Acinetobacter]WOE30340.1 ATP-binding protein [Acinetobacter sp. SAAs470]WOE38531.1 ATP-binding protein [Acinetobacter sp. SAAs474]